MELILYAKNNMVLKIIKHLLILTFIINSYIINYAFASNKSDKYHTLQVSVTIFDQNSKHKNNNVKKNDLAEIIKKDLLIFHATSEPKLTKHRMENLHDRANQEIINNLQGLGYYHAEVIKTSLEALGDNKWLASYEIVAGPPIIIKQIELQIIGNTIKNIELKKIKHTSQKLLHINQQLNHDDYEKTKQLILNQLHDYGFLNAQFATSKIEINLEKNTANIVFIINAMQQYYLGTVTFESDLYESDFLNKYIPFKEKELYSTDKLMQLKNNLLNSGLFSKVRIDTEDLSKLKNNTVPILARVYAKPANRYTGGIGFGTDTGIRGNLGYARRRKSHPGHEININLAGSKIRKQAIADYSFLGKNPMIDKYNFGIVAMEGHVKERFNKNAELYTQKSKQYSTRQQFLKLSFLTETFRELPALPKKHANFLMPSIRLAWTHHKNNTQNGGFDDLDQDETNHNKDHQQSATTFGNKITITTKIASKTMASSNLLQLTANEKLIQPLIYDFHLIFKGSIATTLISDFNKLPLSLRFFAGGDDSVRGFAYNSLGPYAKDPAGNKGVIGGKHLFFTSLEIEKPIPTYPQLSAAWFIDAGNALNTFNKFSLNKLAIGTGLGIGYKTPIGSVRAYLAKPIKHIDLEDAAKKRVRVHLTFGANL